MGRSSAGMENDALYCADKRSARLNASLCNLARGIAPSMTSCRDHRVLIENMTSNRCECYGYITGAISVKQYSYYNREQNGNKKQQEHCK